MSSLQDRIAAAAAPTFEVKELVGRGGMGAVYRAYDLSLDRWVAIKVLLPEHATEAAERRFLREARILARLQHSHIVPIHQVHQKDGLSFFVMDFIEGVTLAHALRDRSFNLKRTRALGKELLTAVQAVHGQGIVHCDIKPSNIFLAEGHMCLGDFGIATPPIDSDATETQRGIVGTPMYMAPEQSAGREPVPQTDLYAVGLVLYEAFQGRPWPAATDPQDGDWAGVPFSLRRVLRRALQLRPENRWASASDFLRALENRGAPRVAIAAAAMGIGALAVAGYFQITEGAAREHVVQIEAGLGTNSVHDSMARVVTGLLYEALGVGIDFRICRPSDACDPATLTVRVRVSGRGDSLVLAARSLEDVPAVSATQVISQNTPITSVDSLATDVLLQIWQTHSPIYADLPTDALPHSPEGMREFILAERLWQGGRFHSAKTAYTRAVEIDPTCYLCSWRITEMQRWLQESPEPEHYRRTLDNITVFPEHYQLLIGARSKPLQTRLSMLRLAIERGGGFPLARFAHGDELLHRGGLVGARAEEAADELYAVAQRSPLFVPAQEHAAWALAAIGDTARAAVVMSRLDSLPAYAPEAQVSRALYRTALAYRFGDGPDDRTLLEDLPRLLQDPRADAGPRWMIGFGTPDGAVKLGMVWEEYGPRAGGDPSAGVLAQYFGHIGLGQLDSARSVGNRIARSFLAGDDFAAFDAQLRAALQFIDGQNVQSAVPSTELERSAVRAASPNVRESTSWMLQLVTEERDPVPADIIDGGLRGLIEANNVARSGDMRGALELSDSLYRETLASDVPGSQTRADDYPFFRSMLYVLRARWYEGVGERENAVRALRWHENTDMPRLPIGSPTSYEVDWALGGMASWKRVGLLDVDEATPEVCRLYGEVARRWRNGDVAFAARADSATYRWDALACATTTRDEQ